jgi:hypothetical protein
MEEVWGAKPCREHNFDSVEGRVMMVVMVVVQVVAE